MNINHEPIFDPVRIEEYYTEKDGVPVKYICTSALGMQEFATDVFYRETPHPEFGNRYFALYRNPFADNAQIMITNADVIEDLDFAMIKDSDDNYHYSAHRHDYKVVEEQMIDGGRAYTKTNGCTTYSFKIKDGEFMLLDQE